MPATGGCLALLGGPVIDGGYRGPLVAATRIEFASQRAGNCPNPA
jgi:hypothetical protein